MPSAQMFELLVDFEDLGFSQVSYAVFSIKRKLNLDVNTFVPEYSKIYKNVLSNTDSIIKLAANTIGTMYECIIYGEDKKSIGHFLFEMPEQNCWLSDLIKYTSNNINILEGTSIKNIYLGQKVKFTLTCKNLNVNEEFCYVYGKLVDEEKNLIAELVINKTSEKDIIIVNIDASNWAENLAGKQLRYNLVFMISDDGVEYDTIYVSPVMYINVQYSPSYTFGV